ncbi:sphingosine N-acyltransferase lag1 [Podila epigama]|nr:sphingosine N-acyltransferase lag1 [Podila epigama]
MHSPTAAASSPAAVATSTSTSTPSALRPRLSARERSNSFRRKTSIDSETGQPHHYDHRRHHHHDPTKGRSPSPPEGTARLYSSAHFKANGNASEASVGVTTAAAAAATSTSNGERLFKTGTITTSNSVTGEESIYTYNADGFLIPTRTVVEQSWSSFLIQHQLVLSTAMLLATFLSHILIMAKETREGHRVDWISSLTALIPPPIWSNLPPSWTNATLGVPAMVKKWGGLTSKNGYNPNEAWSSQALALQYATLQVTGEGASKTTTLLYGKGCHDLYMVFVWIMIWTALREAAITFLLIPLGRSFGVGEPKRKTKKVLKQEGGGARTVQADDKDDDDKDDKRKLNTANNVNTKEQITTETQTIRRTKEEHAREGKLLRFAEQGWLVIYDGCMWTFGMYLLYNAEYWSDTTFYWRDYPKTLLTGTMKWYYLIQFAFWLQQLLLAILGIEKRRKDFMEFMIHHIITCLLIGFSYSFNLTSVGHAVLCAMDFSDIVLAACKMLKYMHKDALADVGFVFFMVTWVMSRHYYFGIIIWSSFVEAPVYANQTWDPAKGLYFTPNVLKGFLVLLCSLYAVLLFWLGLIVRVALKVLKGENSEDVRSEDEDDLELEEQAETKEKHHETTLGKEETVLQQTLGSKPVNVSG